MVQDLLLEGRIEVPVVEEDVRVVEPTVEVSLHGLDGLQDTLELFIPGKDDECGVGTRLRGRLFLRVETTSHEDFVVLLADFPVKHTVLVMHA